jgi:hypothetical protein
MDQSFNFPDTFAESMVNDQNQAYYESLQQDMEKDILREMEEIDRQTKLKEELIKNEIELKLKLELEQKLELERKLELEQNQPSKEELRQRRLKFYEK